MLMRNLLTKLIIVFVLVVPSLAQATTRFVDATSGACSGTYSILNHNCSGADGTSYSTINSAMAASSAGDRIYLRAGVYTTQLFNNNHNGTSVSAMIYLGTCPSSVCPGEAARGAIIRVSGATRSLYDQNGNNWNFWQFDNLTWDGVNGTEGSSGIAFTVTSPSSNHDVWFTNSEIKNMKYNGLYLEGDNHIVRGMTIHDNVSSDCVAPHRYYGVYYAHGSNGLIERSEIYNNVAGGMQLYPGASGGSGVPLSNIVVRYNYIHNNNTTANSCNNTGFSAIIIGNGNSGFIINSNIFANNGTSSATTGMDTIRVGVCNGGPSNVLILNNTFYNNGSRSDGFVIRVCTNASATTIQNNHVILGSSSGGLISPNGSTTQTTNRTTGSITDCTVSTSNFTHKVGSSCIDAGTNIGFAFNGIAPDQGAFETPKFSTCSVENVDPSTFRVTINNAVSPPLQPSSSITGFTVRKAGVNNPITGTQLTGTNRVDLSVTNPIVNGNAIDVSYSGGNLTDSSLIGGTINQPFVQTLANQSCTNNVGAGTTQVFTQTVFRFNGLRGTQSAPVATPYASAPENTNIVVVPGGKFRLRIGISCTVVDCASTGFIPRYKRKGGTAIVIPDVFTGDNIAFCGTSPDPDIPATGTSTTQQLSGSGTFVAGALIRTSNAIPNVDMPLNGRTEVEYCIAMSPSAVPGDDYQIMAYQQDGTALVNNVIPKATVTGSQQGMGF